MTGPGGNGRVMSGLNSIGMSYEDVLVKYNMFQNNHHMLHHFNEATN